MTDPQSAASTNNADASSSGGPWAFQVRGKWMRPSEIAAMSREDRTSPDVRDVIMSMGREQFCNFLDTEQALTEQRIRIEVAKEQEKRFAFLGAFQGDEIRVAEGAKIYSAKLIGLSNSFFDGPRQKSSSQTTERSERRGPSPVVSPPNTSDLYAAGKNKMQKAIQDAFEGEPLYDSPAMRALTAGASTTRDDTPELAVRVHRKITTTSRLATEADFGLEPAPKARVDGKQTHFKQKPRRSKKN